MSASRYPSLSQYPVRADAIRMGDPCHDCGIPMTPASRVWSAFTIPSGYRKHAGRGLCGRCIQRRRASGTLDQDLIEPEEARPC